MHYLCIHAIPNDLPEMEDRKIAAVEQICQICNNLSLEGDVLYSVQLNPGPLTVTHATDTIGQVIHPILGQSGGKDLIAHSMGNGRLPAFLAHIALFLQKSSFGHKIQPPF